VQTISEGNRLYASGRYAEALKVYEDVSQVYPGLAASLRLSIVRCQRRLASVNSLKLNKLKDDRFEVERPPSTTPSHIDRDPQIAVTMTTIRSRLPLAQKVVESLHAQRLSPARILLNVSSEPYLLDEGISPYDELLRALSSMPLVKVNWVRNIGSYRRIWPFLEQHFSQSVTTDKLFVTVDDDTIYPDYFLETLFRKYQEMDCIVAFRGRHIEWDGLTIAPYNKWTWGQTTATLRNLPIGKDGILYSTKFFTRDFLALDDALALAPTADDLWIKWHCALNGVPSIILHPEARTSDYKGFPVVDYSSEYRTISLYTMHNSGAKERRNDLTVHRLEKYYLEKYGYDLGRLVLESQVLAL